MFSFGQFPGVWNICRRFGTLYLFHLHRQVVWSVWNVSHFVPPAYEDGTDWVFRNVGIYNSEAGELPKRKHNIESNIFFLLSDSLRLNVMCWRFRTLPQFHLHRRCKLTPPTNMEQSVPKSRHIKFRRRWITQKKEYIQNTAKVWNQESRANLTSVMTPYILVLIYQITRRHVPEYRKNRKRCSRWLSINFAEAMLVVVKCLLRSFGEEFSDPICIVE